MKTKIVFSKWIACRLRDQGFQILKVMANWNKPELDCYVFEATAQLEEAFGQIVQEGRHD